MSIIPSDLIIVFNIFNIIDTPFLINYSLKRSVWRCGKKYQIDNLQIAVEKFNVKCERGSYVSDWEVGILSHIINTDLAIIGTCIHASGSSCSYLVSPHVYRKNKFSEWGRGYWRDNGDMLRRITRKRMSSEATRLLLDAVRSTIGYPEWIVVQVRRIACGYIVRT